MNNFVITEYWGREYLLEGDTVFKEKYLTNSFNIKKIAWTENETKHNIEALDSAACIPFFNENRIVLLFENQPEFPAPNNLVIYNSNGCVFKILQPPFFLHPESISRITPYLRAKKRKLAEAKIVFCGLPAKKEIDGSNYLLVMITESEVFEYSGNFETRALNVETGEWHPSFREFVDSRDNNGHGQTYN